MEIILAKTAGFCFGVDRAVHMAQDNAPCCTLGSLIHNRHVLSALARKGIRTAETPDDIPPDIPAVIRAHGVGRDVQTLLTARALSCVDATCPFVKKIHHIVQKENETGRRVIIIGNAAHPEVIGIAGWCENALVFSDGDSLLAWLNAHPGERDTPFSVVVQTTHNRITWESCIKTIRKECTNVKIFDTICNATDERQTEARTIAAAVDAMLVIGDRGSSNTLKLHEISSELCGKVHLIEGAREFDPSMIQDAHRVGVTAGASTPAWIIKEVLDKMSEELKKAQDVQAEEAQAAQELAEESFASLLEQSIKTLYTGEKVTGVITQITPSEVHVDLGVKQAGYIPLDELSDDPTYKAEDNLTVGQEIEAFVMRVNDVEGTVMLSKKRLDSIQGWERIEQARESRDTLEGIVTEDNKGGVVVSVNGVRVFVPASQTGLPKDAAMSSLVKTRVKLRVTEVNRARRRVVGSIRVVQMEDRRTKSDQIWSTIDVGQSYHGVVKSLTSYGAFVDIGGVDGMVHISELSWSRVKHPSDVVKVGDALDVFVIGLDREKKKISLGYRRTEDNPWSKFTTTYQVGDVASVKVLKFMPFGAFAEVLPGVDGLIHISQIADHRIAKPDDVLSEGEVVDAVITDIDHERQKISLSIRALLERGHDDVQADDTYEQE